ncbi:Gypsy retrotransposon integrase-like protein 1 [Exophiala xenobiotica]|nr:Gypsy retrotransposon integrase-like protein 1 [Exophiala xenobiotica]
MADDVTVLSSSTESPAREALRQPSVQIAESAGRNDSIAPDSQPGSPSAEIATDEEGNTKPHAPMQKRRRVTRACDECRRKKIKCDGKQPCTHCTVYSYECTYDQPSNRRRNPAPQYIEALEQRLQKAESILRSVLPGIDLDDPKFDARSVEQLIETSRTTASSSIVNGHAVPTADASKPDDDAQLQSMVDRTGALDLDHDGHWDFHGHSSGYVFMRKFRAQFGESYLSEYRHPNRSKTISQILESPKSAQSSPYEFNLPPGVDLPPKEVAIELSLNALDDCCALMRPIHKPTYFTRLHAVYDTDPEQWNNEHVQFLPLIYVVMAVGGLFSKSEDDNATLDRRGYKEAIEQGYQYFNTAKQMLDITDCRDLVTIQAIVFMIVFLQSTAKLPVCYAYIGIAMRACCRLGLHRNIPNRFNPIELEERKRIFWLVRKLDSYVGAVLGLPQMLSDDDIDQELPTEVDDEYITAEGIRPMPTSTFPLLKATNAHTRLTNILRKVVRYIYPVKGVTGGGKADSRYSISHKRIRELERDLQTWMDQLPTELRPSDNAGRDLSRVQQLLRMSYAHVQMMVYRPFVHYVTQACQSRNVDKRSFACAAACISVARNIVHITTEMKRRGLLVGSYWFVMYTTYFAILSLVFFVIENPNSPTGQDILKDAVEGRDTLAALAKRSMAADRCSASLAGLFEVLPEKLKERRSSLNAPPSTSRKRPPPVVTEGFASQDREAAQSSSTPSSLKEAAATPSRTRTLPSDFLAKLAKRNSMPDPHLLTGLSEGAAAQMQNHQMFGYQSPSTASPMSGHFDFAGQLGNAQIPDLKNVMFPSDNPFAYPNQPISTLESGDASYSFPDPNLGYSDHSMSGTPTGGSTHMSIPTPQYDNGFSFQQALGENPGSAQAFAAHGRHFGAPITDLLMQNAIGGEHMNLGGLPHFHDPLTTAGNDVSGTSQHEEFWKGSTGTNTVPPPGLEDYFNNERLAWDSSWGDHRYYTNA